MWWLVCSSIQTTHTFSTSAVQVCPIFASEKRGGARKFQGHTSQRLWSLFETSWKLPSWILNCLSPENWRFMDSQAKCIWRKNLSVSKNPQWVQRLTFPLAFNWFESNILWLALDETPINLKQFIIPFIQHISPICLLLIISNRSISLKEKVLILIKWFLERHQLSN